MSSTNNQLIPFYTSRIGSWQISIGRQAMGSLELSRRYDQLAKKWHRLITRLGYPQAYRRLWGQFFENTQLAPRAETLRVLDCGVGSGSFALAFTHSWAAPVNIDAIDVSEEMISEARARFRKAGISADFQCGDASSLPYTDNRFDVVMAAHILEHLPNPVLTLREVQRVLKPGGWLVVSATRDSILGRYIQLKWRTHVVNATRAQSWLESAGFKVCDKNLALTGNLGRSSIVCIGEKPD